MKINGSMENNRARVHKISEIHKGKCFSFTTEDVTLPNGVRSEMSMVRHPGSTGIVPLLDENTLLLIRQYRHPIKAFIYEIPSGTMDPGENDPLICARRELEEETGYTAGTFIDIGSIYILPAYSDEKLQLYLAKNLLKTKQNLDEDEIIDVVSCRIDEAMEMISSGQIVDALTILAIQSVWIGFFSLP